MITVTNVGAASPIRPTIHIQGRSQDPFEPSVLLEAVHRWAPGFGQDDLNYAEGRQAPDTPITLSMQVSHYNRTQRRAA